MVSGWLVILANYSIPVWRQSRFFARYLSDDSQDWIFIPHRSPRLFCNILSTAPCILCSSTRFPIYSAVLCLLSSVFCSPSSVVRLPPFAFSPFVVQMSFIWTKEGFFFTRLWRIYFLFCFFHFWFFIIASPTPEGRGGVNLVRRKAYLFQTLRSCVPIVHPHIFARPFYPPMADLPAVFLAGYPPYFWRVAGLVRHLCGG